ncbi:annexin A5-like [Lineus longissimus]|uniref:annexin A5-like n=1 Tax=Lineus longissimus TaxID=88925 RepID=UPI002B4D351C
MSYGYQSNYSSGPPPPPRGGGPFGYAAASSGPPPPPPSGYGYQQQSAYNVNYSQGGYQSVYSNSGAVPGFTVPAVQSVQQQYQTVYQGHAPAPCQMPYGMHVKNMDQQMQSAQMQQMQAMQQQYARMAMRGQKKKSRKYDDDDDDDYDSEDDDEEEYRSKGKKKAPKKPVTSEQIAANTDIKAEIKRMTVDELIRRQTCSGTFELTEGTVKPSPKYAAEDPVVKFYSTERSTDLVGKPWDSEADCEYLRKAMKGLGTNEDAIIHVVATRCNAQRQELKKKFKTMYGRDLIDDLHSELSGDFRESIMACFVKPAVYDAWAIKEAIYGLGTDEKTLIEILMTRTNAQLEEMKQVYPDVASPNRKKKANLIERDIKDDTSGDFKRLMIAAVQANRSEIGQEQLEKAVEEQMVNGKGTGIFNVNYQKLANIEAAKRDANLLFKAGEDRWGTDEETFVRIFSTRDYYQLREIWNQYVKITQRDILNSIDRETSGDFKRGLAALVCNIRCRPMYFAQRLRDAMKGLGTDDKTLIRVVVSRAEIDMVQIKQCFLELTKKTLWKWIKEDTSGDYKKILQAIVGKD